MEYPPLVGAQNIFITKSDIPFLTGIHVTSFRNGHIHKQNPPPTCTLHAKAGESSRYGRDAGCFCRPQRP